MSIDTDKLRIENPLSEVIASRGIKVEKDGREYKCLCPLHKEKSPSFYIYPGRKKTQEFYCFGCGESGDVIRFVELYDGVSFNDACKILGGDQAAPDRDRTPRQLAEVSDPYAGYVVTRPPDNAPELAARRQTPPILNPKRLDDNGRPRSVVYRPSMVFPYRDRKGGLLFYVLRQDIGSRHKITPTILWAKNEATGFEGWTHGQPPEPCPLYRLDALTADRQIIVVEGEKAADAAARLLPMLDAVAWRGGTKAVGRAAWKPLAKRNVLLWADNDPGGEAAMLGGWTSRGEWKPGAAELLLELGCRVKYIGPDRNLAQQGVPEDKIVGFDIADCEALKWDTARALAYAKDRAELVTLETIARYKGERSNAPDDPEPEQDREQEAPANVEQLRPTSQTKPALDKKAGGKRPQVKGEVLSIATGKPIDIDPDAVDWRAHCIFDDKDKLKPKSLKNYIAVLERHAWLGGIYGMNTFTNELCVLRQTPWFKDDPGPFPRPHTPTDMWQTRAFLETLGLQPTDNDAGAAATVAAGRYAFNPVREYLDGLTWDGVPRLRGGLYEGESVQCWLAEYMGADQTEINAVFGAKWMISAVARVYDPGCKVDTMLILEGPQGKKKSSALKELATIGDIPYFTDAVRNIGDKDADMVMRGCWIIEIAELQGFNRTEFATIKAWLSRGTDRYRPPYGKSPQNFPRSSVLAGTVNPQGSGYLRDPTGARRFWPAWCGGTIEIERLKQDRHQLWAEAVALYRAGKQWWLTDSQAAEAEVVQAARYQEDPWADPVREILDGEKEITIAKILVGLGIPKGQWTQIHHNRIVDHLKQKGFVQKSKRMLNGKVARVYIKEKPDDDNE